MKSVPEELSKNIVRCISGFCLFVSFRIMFLSFSLIGESLSPTTAGLISPN